MGLEDQLSGPCSVVAWEEGWERREKNPRVPYFLALLLCERQSKSEVSTVLYFTYATLLCRDKAESIPKHVLRCKLGTRARGSVFSPNQPQIQVKSTDLCPITTPVVLLV